MGIKAIFEVHWVHKKGWEIKRGKGKRKGRKREIVCVCQAQTTLYEFQFFMIELDNRSCRSF